jgi:heterotetrameric sarcosine oxidase delta subunit
MLLLPCPHCGPRDQAEFTWGGDAAVPCDGEAHFLRDNPRGALVELWHHSTGCGAWFRVRRDTATHELLE